MTNRIENAVVIITGASSGIGRATAHRFAEQGARLVLAARRDQALEEAADECRNRGALALAVPTDVTDEEQVENLMREAIQHFGRVDILVNNAGVMMFGGFLETPPVDFRRVIDVNLFGYVSCARAVLRHFMGRGRGIIINNASIVGHLGQPYSAAYVTSKYAVRGFAVALRQELIDYPEIQVCSVLPSAIDTPLWQHTANFTGQAFTAMHPAYDAYTVADAIVGLAERPRREVVAGTMGKLMVLQHRFLPDMTERLMARVSRRAVFKSQPAAKHHGNLFNPLRDGHKVNGGWRLAPNHIGTYAVVAAAAVPLAMALVGRRWRPALFGRG